jgi:hypothetical protein
MLRRWISISVFDGKWIGSLEIPETELLFLK